MKGDQLVAEVKIDPGVCSVSVKQLAQFETDFQVSTPRLTASVKGSAHTITAHALEEFLADTVRVDEHVPRILQAWGGARYVSAGGSANSKNQGPEQIALLNSIVEVLADLAANEQAPDLQNAVNQTIANLGSDLNGLGLNQRLNFDALPPADEPAPDGNQVEFSNATAQLTWGANPNDLDLHVKVTNPNQTMFEVFYANRDSPDGLVHLDRDDTDGFGPETITVDQFVAGGMYRYFVHHFSGTGTLGTSNAVLTVQEQGGGNRVFQVNPSATEEYWHVFDFNVQGGTASVVPVDTYSNSEPPFPGTGQ